MADAVADEQQLKQRAMRRLAIALGLIALAIFGLAVLDRYTGSSGAPPAGAPADEPPAIATLPPPQPIAPPPAASVQPPETMAPDTMAQAPETMAQPPKTMAQPPKTMAQPPETKAQPPETKAQPLPPPPSVEDEQTVVIAPRPADAARAPSRSVPPPAAARLAPTPSAPVAGEPARLPAAPAFVVQLGMFSSVENAQALLERLKAQGVPVYLETRVVVGPFRDRAEADAAQRKLQAAGVAGVIAQRK